MKRVYKHKTELERFSNHYVKSGNGCWEWLSAKNTTGYGEFSERQGPGKYKLVLAHRKSYQLFNGYITNYILHSCDNPSCVNPEHLRDGSHHDNMNDRADRNRQAKGTNNGGGKKLSEQNVLQIRELWNNRRGTRGVLAHQFGVCSTMIMNIVEGKSWKHLTKAIER